MGLLDYFNKKKPKSAQVAKERLQIVISHERLNRNGPDYLPQMRRDIVSVISKYVKINEEAVNVQFERGDDCDILELNIALPERAS